MLSGNKCDSSNALKTSQMITSSILLFSSDVITAKRFGVTNFFDYFVVWFGNNEEDDIFCRFRCVYGALARFLTVFVAHNSVIIYKKCNNDHDENEF